MRSPARLLLVLVLLLGVGLRLFAAVGKFEFEHDDAMTYLTAAGHPIEEGVSYSGHWILAGAWKNLIKPKERSVFKDITTLITQSKILHPPLYFICLNYWSQFTNVTPTSGATLNIFFAALAALLLFMISKRLLLREDYAVGVVAIWFLSPGVVSISSAVRQYDLLTMITIWFLLQISCYRSNSNLVWLGLLVLTTAIGILTHYYFIGVVISGSAYLIASSSKLNYKSNLRGLLGIAIGCAVLPIIYPEFYKAFMIKEFVRTDLFAGGVGEKIRMMAIAIATFPLGKAYISTGGIFFGAVNTFLWGIIVLSSISEILKKIWRMKFAKSYAEYIRSENGQAVFAFWIFCLLGFNALIYLSGFVPSHAMGTRYLSILWPFLSALPFITTTPLGKQRFWIIYPIIISNIALSYLNISYDNRLQEEIRQSKYLFNDYRFYLLDSTSSGILPRVVNDIPDNSRVFADSQDRLLSNPQVWLNGFNGETGIYVSSSPYYSENAEQKRDKILKLLSEYHHVTKLYSYSYDFLIEYYSVGPPG